MRTRLRDTLLPCVRLRAGSSLAFEECRLAPRVDIAELAIRQTHLNASTASEDATEEQGPMEDN
jgi:hypothetical protein